MLCVCDRAVCEGVVCERVVCERVMFASWVCVRVRVTNLCVSKSVCVCVTKLCGKGLCVTRLCVCERDVFASRVWQSYVSCVSQSCACVKGCVCVQQCCV
jgi:hypothetical protein